MLKSVLVIMSIVVLSLAVRLLWGWHEQDAKLNQAAARIYAPLK